LSRRRRASMISRDDKNKRETGATRVQWSGEEIGESCCLAWGQRRKRKRRTEKTVAHGKGEALATFAL